MTQTVASFDDSDTPLIDRTALDPIVKVTGPAVMRRIADVFWSTTGEMLGTLRAAIDGGEQEEIRKAAHALKGAASNVGAGRTARIAAAMEKADQAQARAMMAKLEQSLQDTRPALDAILQQAA